MLRQKQRDRVTPFDDSTSSVDTSTVPRRKRRNETPMMRHGNSDSKGLPKNAPHVMCL